MIAASLVNKIYNLLNGHRNRSKSQAEKKIRIGIWDHKRKSNAYNGDELIGSDPDILKDFEESINRTDP